MALANQTNRYQVVFHLFFSKGPSPAQLDHFQVEVHADQQARSPRAGHRNSFFDQRCYLNLSLIFLQINLESKSAKCVPSLSPPRISCQDGSCLQAIIARWGVSVSNWCFQMGHSYIEKPCNYGVYTLIIVSTTCFVATWRYILASLEMLQTLCIAWYLRLAMLAINTDYESC